MATHSVLRSQGIGGKNQQPLTSLAAWKDGRKELPLRPFTSADFFAIRLDGFHVYDRLLVRRLGAIIDLRLARAMTAWFGPNNPAYYYS